MASGLEAAKARAARGDNLSAAEERLILAERESQGESEPQGSLISRPAASPPGELVVRRPSLDGELDGIARFTNDPVIRLAAQRLKGQPLSVVIDAFRNVQGADPWARKAVLDSLEKLK